MILLIPNGSVFRFQGFLLKVPSARQWLYDWIRYGFVKVLSIFKNIFQANIITGLPFTYDTSMSGSWRNYIYRKSSTQLMFMLVSVDLILDWSFFDNFYTNFNEWKINSKYCMWHNLNIKSIESKHCPWHFPKYVVNSI